MKSLCWKADVVLRCVILFGSAIGCARPTEVTPISLESIEGIDLKRRGDDIVVVDLRGVQADSLQAAVSLLDESPKAAELFLPGNAIDTPLVETLKSMPSLKRVRIYGTGLDDSRAHHLGVLSSLEAITLQDTSVTDAGVVSLESMPNLREVSLMNSPVSDACLNSLARCTKLSKLRLRGTKITGKDFGPISTLPIVDLELAETQFGSDGMEAVAKIASLQKLNLWLTQVDDDGLAWVANHPALQSLNLDNCKSITDQSIPSLLTLEGLTLLHIGGTSVTPATVSQLTKLSKLETLFVTRLGVDSQTCESLRQGLPNLKTLECD